MFLEPTEAWQLLGLCTALVVAFLLAVHFTKLKTKVPLFYSWIGAIAIFGGTLAFLLPIALNSGFGKDDDGRVLRQLILYTTGGVLGVITLGESHRKNNQEKEKNENDHTRQVYAERRSRYTKAIEQLADEKATVRLGGIYTLVGLVDEWLTDDSLEQDEHLKEGQVIINSLCSYIRSPFPLAEKIEEYEAHRELENLQKLESEKLGTEESSQLQSLLSRFKDSDEYEKPKDITTDYAQFHEEQDVRHAIFVEMSKRSSTFTMNEKGEIIETISGMWSDFDFDFSRAPVFYPLNAITIEKGNFSGAEFYAGASFENSKWDNLIIFDAVFHNDISFKNAIFSGETHFTGSQFKKSVSFYGANFQGDLHAKRLQICGPSDFSVALFKSNAYFNNSEFHTDMKGRKEDIDWSKIDITKFWRANFKNKDTSKTADFCDTYFYGYTDFKRSIFEISALFGGSRFIHGSNFYHTEFTLADFKGAHFNRGTNFQNSTFSRKAYFAYSESLLGYETFLGATFSYSGDYDFDLLPLGRIRKDVNFDDDCMLYPIGSRVYIDKNGTRIYSSPAHA